MCNESKLREASENFSIMELIYMVSHKCRKQQDSKYSCNECEFLNCYNECCLMGMDAALDPSDWKNIEVETHYEIGGSV